MTFIDSSVQERNGRTTYQNQPNM